MSEWNAINEIEKKWNEITWNGANKMICLPLYDSVKITIKYKQFAWSVWNEN